MLGLACLLSVLCQQRLRRILVDVVHAESIEQTSPEDLQILARCLRRVAALVDDREQAGQPFQQVPLGVS